MKKKSLLQRYGGYFIAGCCGAIIVPLILLLIFVSDKAALTWLCTGGVGAFILLMIELVLDEKQSDKERKIRHQERQIMLDSIKRNQEVTHECLEKIDMHLQKKRMSKEDEEFFNSAREIKSMLQGH